MSQDFAQILTVAIYLLTTLVWVRDGGNWIWGCRAILGAAALLVATADRYFWFSHSLSGFMRNLALEYDWYDSRRWLQTLAALMLASVIVAMVLIRFRAIPTGPSIWRLSASTIFLLALLGFCCLRALSNHYVDAWLSVSVVGLRVNWIVEWLLLGLVIACASIWRSEIHFQQSRE